MYTTHGHLTYCTNIHAGESWDDHFTSLRKNVPIIKQQVAPHQKFGIGLRLSNMASYALQDRKTFGTFRQWLDENQCYVFTMNGFPYGGFHHTAVKDQVHAPDWTTEDRVAYTLRLFDLLAALLPDNMDGGISTSPLSYKYWHLPGEQSGVMQHTTANILRVVEHLINLYKTTGKLLHLDIEPEPDGLLESGPEFIDWYEHQLLPQGIDFLQDKFNYMSAEAVAAIRRHVQLCYDVCHFAVGYEDHHAIVKQLREKQIGIGKIQISAALKATLPTSQTERGEVIEAFRRFNEPTYLHQVVALKEDGTLMRYPDLPEALNDADNSTSKAWRSHFHVPLFVEDYGKLESTQADIRTVLSIHQQQSLTAHLEVETYTWEVLPENMKLPIADSIVREMKWVHQFLDLPN